MTSERGGPAAVGARVDLTNCEREPIHVLGLIQDFGFLIAVSADWIVQFASANLGDYIGIDADAAIGKPIAGCLPQPLADALRMHARQLRGSASETHLSAVSVDAGGRLFDVSVHVSGSDIVLEFEPSKAGGSDDSHLGTIRTVIARLQKIDAFDEFFHQTARFIQYFTGYDRVMVYRFLADGAGEVIAESKRHDMEPYLGLRYPASDIPKQARALYLRNPIRCIADVDSTPIAIEPAASSSNRPLDLSQCFMRSVSPIHLEYLRNMGVRASMSVSIVRESSLWGLIACHHRKPKILHRSKRNAADLFGQMFSLVLENMERATVQADVARASRLQVKLLATIADHGSHIEQLGQSSSGFRQLIPCDGLAVCIDGKIVLDGFTPTLDETKGLLRFLNSHAAAQIVVHNKIGATYEPGRDFVERAAGLLAIPISRTPRDYLIFFRRELSQIVNWAGDPDKPVTSTADGARLTPRKSFETYRKITQGECKAWSESDISISHLLKTSLLESIMRLKDIANQEKKIANEKQELLISELNHRVRNLLGLVRSIINQSKDTVSTTGDYVNLIDGRVRALARAHDQITKHDWSPGSVKALIQTEGEAYLSKDANRLSVDGPDIYVHPVAFSGLALVIHELMTNSVKYGALSADMGRVAINLALDDGGRLIVEWNETGGPPVRPPTRRGFGSTIIERSIPFELRGEASIAYRLEGVSARFAIPATYVTATHVGAGAEADAAPVPSANATEPSVPSHVLIVEDNIIIAMDAEDILAGLGAKEINVVSSVRDALAAIERALPDFALLDVNLGSENSFPIADRLAEHGVRYAFATGYGDQATFPSAHARVARLAKPFDKSAIKNFFALHAVD